MNYDVLAPHCVFFPYVFLHTPIANKGARCKGGELEIHDRICKPKSSQRLRDPTRWAGSC